MRHSLPVLLLTAALLVLGFAVLGVLAVPSADAPVRRVLGEVPSPTGSHVALVVEVSGGGAAGYVHEEVQLQRLGAPIPEEVATRLRGVQLQWDGPAALRVGCEHGLPGRAQVDGVAVTYAKTR
ncbi:MAG: hypothetical protein RL148_1779 [Planctomycetota bacterium]|jgi:uncharacterized protein (DUF58 family)